VAPAELARRPQWVAWRLVSREGEPKPTKVPYDARTGRMASTTDPRTWATFEEAAAFCAHHEWASGVGYVLSADDPYVGIDLDGCRDPRSGRLEPWAKAIVKRLTSYTEISPSGTGLRIFVRGELPPHGRRKGSIEIYSQARFLTITGDHYLAAPDTIQDRPAELLEWHREIFGDGPQQRQNGTATRSPVQLADADLLLKARSSEHGAAFWALWNGDYSAYGSQSEADLALVNYLAFWTGPDPARIDQLFRSSGLMRDKWDREDYRTRTIDKALDGRTDYYSPASSSPQLVIGHTVDPVTGEVIEESPWRTAGELVRYAPESGRQIVEGFIWEGRTHWIYSGPGAGKTLTTLALLLHVAAGKPFHDRPTIQGPVVVIEEDSPDSVIADYLQMLAEIYDIDLDAIPLWFNRARNIRIKDQAGLDYVRGMIAKTPQKPLVCMLDACERLVPSETFNSNELDCLSRLFTLNQLDGITNLMIDHTRKPGSSNEKIDLIDMLYGGRTKSAISDVMMFYSGTIKTQATVSFPKFRGVEPTPINISFDGSAGFTLRTNKPILSESERQVMLVITNAFGKWLTREDLEAQAKLGTSTVQRALRRLLEMGWVERDGDNRMARYKAGSLGGGMFS
jgi:putative DNA primase/helicase